MRKSWRINRSPKIITKSAKFYDLNTKSYKIQNERFPNLRCETQSPNPHHIFQTNQNNLNSNETASSTYMK